MSYMPDLPNLVVKPQKTSTSLIDYCLMGWAGRKAANEIKKGVFQGMVTINGKKGKPRDMVRSGDLISWGRSKKNSRPNAPHLHLHVIYEDPYSIAINKPEGIAVNGKRGNDLEALLAKFVSLPDNEGLRAPVAIHRIDVPTTGIVLFAKTKAFLTKMSALFKGQRVNKTYTAIVLGALPEKGLLNDPIHQKKSHTSFFRLKTWQHPKYGTLSLVRLHPKTGRTHQLRIHLSEAGHPILGDLQYGDATSSNNKHLMLCAQELSFTHPITHKKTNIRCPQPSYFEVCLRT